MPRQSIKAAAGAVVILISLAFASAVSAADKPCYQCHPSKLKGDVVHSPVKDKDCTACHNSVGSKHQLEKGLNGVKKSGAALCYECHDNLAKEKSVHAPIKEGDCASCHAPHHSPHKKLLKAAAGDLCYECHDRQKFIKPFPHSPVATGSCLDCHVPHQSAAGKLIKPAKDGICFECHDATIANGKSVHMPVADKECASCHDPHGAGLSKLLKGNYPSEPGAVFSEAAYSLCLGCHEKAAFTESEISSATGFRDGKNNLHALHVKDAGVTCRMCHLVHAAPQARLIRDKAPGKDKVEIIINFTEAKNGGSCKMTCHSPSSYSR